MAREAREGREGPYRQAAVSSEAPGARVTPARPAFALALMGGAMVLLAGPVVALAMQPFSGCATTVAGALATWTAVALVRLRSP